MIASSSRALLDYRGRIVVVTGGLGFLGSNLAVWLAQNGARVRVVDSLAPGCGGSYANLDGFRDRIEVFPCDIREAERVRPALHGAEVVFNLAGDISHTGSMRDPWHDLDLNVVAQLGFLQLCAKAAPGIRVVYTSTRQVYGKGNGRPVDEGHPVEPVDFNGVHKYTTTHYHLLLGRLGLIDPIVLRLTNVYGPRMALHASGQGFLAAFFRHALDGEPIRVFGDGLQRRDLLHVEDAVTCLLLAGQAPPPPHRVFNVGHAASVSILEVAEELSRLAACLPLC